MDKNKKFDCLAFKESAQLAIYEDIKNKKLKEQVEYFHTALESGKFSKWWRSKLKERKAA